MAAGCASFFWFNLTKTSIAGTTPIVPTLAIAAFVFVLGSLLGRQEKSEVLSAFDL